VQRAGAVVHVRVGCSLLCSILTRRGSREYLACCATSSRARFSLYPRPTAQRPGTATAVDWVVKAEDCSAVQCASDEYMSTGTFT